MLTTKEKFGIVINCYTDNIMTIFNHLGILLFIIGFYNIIELFQKNPYNSESCPDWWIPTFAGIILFCIIEFFLLSLFLMLM